MEIGAIRTGRLYMSDNRSADPTADHLFNVLDSVKYAIGTSLSASGLRPLTFLPCMRISAIEKDLELNQLAQCCLWGTQLTFPFFSLPFLVSCLARRL